MKIMKFSAIFLETKSIAWNWHCSSAFRWSCRWLLLEQWIPWWVSMRPTRQGICISFWGDGRWGSWVNLDEPTLSHWELRTVLVSWGNCPTLAGFLGWFMMFQPEESFSSSLFVKYRYLHLSSQHGNTALPKVCWTPKLPKRIEQYFRHFQDDLYFMFPDICQNGWCFVTST